MYVDISRRLRNAVRRKRNEKWRTKCWSILHDKAPAHRSGLVKDVLAKNSVATLERPSYFPDLAAATEISIEWTTDHLVGTALL
jgi:transposase